MQRDAWYSSMRDAMELAAPEAVGRYAAERALARLAARKVPTCEVPVLFESSLSAGMVGAYVQATSGGALYRRATFLLDSIGQQVLADHLAPGRGLLIYRVRNLADSQRALVERGWSAESESVELPQGPCRVFHDPAGQRLAIYERVRPGMDQRFAGRFPLAASSRRSSAIPRVRAARITADLEGARPSRLTVESCSTRPSISSISSTSSRSAI